MTHNNIIDNNFLFGQEISIVSPSFINFYKEGNKIKIKKVNKGKFTEYCGGKVTSECIKKGKSSTDPKIRKRAIFAQNAKRFKHPKK